MTHLCVRGFQWSRKSPCAHSHPWIWIQIPPSALPKHSQILCGWSAPQRWVICGDSSEFGEVNEFSVRYVQGSYFVLKCSDCIQHVVWKLISSLKLQVKSVQVTGDVSKKSQLCDPAWVFQLWLPFSFAVQESANLREEAQKPFKHFSTGQPSHFTVHQ